MTEPRHTGSSPAASKSLRVLAVILGIALFALGWVLVVASLAAGDATILTKIGMTLLGATVLIVGWQMIWKAVSWLIVFPVAAVSLAASVIVTGIGVSSVDPEPKGKSHVATAKKHPVKSKKKSAPNRTNRVPPKPRLSLPPVPTRQDAYEDRPEPTWRRPTTTRRPATTSSPAVRYANCTEVRDAGVAPLHRGDPGYRTGLDRDRDGTACEDTADE